MKTLILAALAAALVLPASAPSQAQTGSGSETSAAPGGGAEGSGKASGTSDPSGSYTIVTVSSGEIGNNDDDSSSVATANRNTDPASIQKTIDANPGLAEKLAEEGVSVGNIGAISVEPNGKVVIYDKP